MQGAGVIIVEDEAIIATDMGAVLQRRGHRVLATVSDADEAVAKTGELWPDIVLMDIVLDGEKSGIEAAGRIAALYDVPVLFVTSHADEPTVRQARETGPYGYILKPISDPELIISVEMTLYRHALDRRLRASEEKYRRLFDNIRDVFFRTDPNGVLVLISPSVRRIAGYEPEEILGCEVVGFFEESKRRDEARETVEKGGYLDYFEARLRRKDGSLFWGSVSAQSYLDSRGNWAGVEGTIRDISARKRAEGALRESEETLRSLINANPEALFLIDTKGAILASNESLSKYLGRRAEELIGSCLYNFLPPPQAELFKKRVEEALRTAGPVRFEHRDGGSFFTDYVYPIAGRNGALSRLAVFITDVTDHRKAVAEIKRLSSEIMTSQEKERQKVARDLHDGVGQTIIAAKLNFAAFKKDRRKYRDRFDTGLRFIDKGSQELREVYTGLYPSILSDLGLEATVRWYAKNYLEANGIETALNLNVGKLPHDLEVNLYRMVQEIFSNIIRHSGAGRVAIELSRPVTGRAVVLAVEDDGFGFDADGLDETKKGFGLSNLRQRAETLGGEVGISSRPGRGTRIAVWIPLGGNHE